MHNSFLTANFDLRKDAKYGGKPPAGYRVVLVDWETHQLIDKFRDKLTVTNGGSHLSGLLQGTVNYKGAEHSNPVKRSFVFIFQYDFIEKQII